MEANPNKTFKQLKQKQKAKISDWLYKEDIKNISLDGKRVLIVVGENRGIDDAPIVSFAK